jgi:anionic cell wall polymer biosynthesis LytR-Cps2A-Psr (LCP) family protein
MTVMVGVLDRDEPGSNTDILVHVDGSLRRLTWIPRDLWCESVRNRVNRAWAIGGAEALRRAAAEHGLGAEHQVIVQRSAAEACLGTVDVEVPVRQRERLWYPLAPTEPIEDGRRAIEFDPPAERLRGERVHQWIGARYRLDGSGTDLDRIARQQVLLRELLRNGFDFSIALTAELRPELSAEAAAVLRRVGPDWLMATLHGLIPAQIAGKAVLMRNPRS